MAVNIIAFYTRVSAMALRGSAAMDEAVAEAARKAAQERCRKLAVFFPARQNGTDRVAEVVRSLPLSQATVIAWAHSQ